MSKVSVSRDALHSVKSAFRDFQTSVESATDHMKSHAEDIIANTRASIKKQQAVAESVKSKVTSISADVEQCQTQIISNNNQLSSLKGSIANASSRSNGLDNQIAQLNAQKHRLLSQNSSNGDNGNDTNAQIRAIENQIQSCERKRWQLNEQIASMRSQESSLNAQNVKLRDDKTRLDSALATAKNELRKVIEKSEKLKSAGTTVESSINSFLGVAQQFKQTAMTTNSTSQSGIEKCIAAIDEYEAVNLGESRRNGSYSMNTVSEMRQIVKMDAAGETDYNESDFGQAIGTILSMPVRGTSYSSQVMSCPSGPSGYHYEAGPNNTHHAYGQLALVTREERGERNNYAQRTVGGSRRHPDDDGGHLIGYRFGGAGETGSPNLFPQNRAVNRHYSADGSGTGSYLEMEDRWEQLLNEGNHVYVDIYASSANADTREDSVYGSYTVVRPDGSSYVETFEFMNENTPTQDTWNLNE